MRISGSAVEKFNWLFEPLEGNPTKREIWLWWGKASQSLQRSGQRCGCFDVDCVRCVVVDFGVIRQL